VGGAIYHHGADSSLVNCLLIGNSAEWYGGAVFFYGHSLFLDLTTIANNASGWYGGGLYVYGGDSTAWIHNSIAALNSAPYGAQMALESWVVAYVWSSDFYGTQPIYVSSMSFVEWQNGNINADPMFVDAASSNYHLQLGSPCVDAGSNEVLPVDWVDLDGDGDLLEPVPYDLDDHPRVARFTVDMGSYEIPFGDLNCDGSVNFGDINPFVLALSNASGWQVANPGCEFLYGDINADGSVGFGDINPFVALLTGS
jgi:hypothetical protein